MTSTDTRTEALYEKLSQALTYKHNAMMHPDVSQEQVTEATDDILGVCFQLFGGSNILNYCGGREAAQRILVEDIHALSRFNVMVMAADKEVNDTQLLSAITDLEYGQAVSGVIAKNLMSGDTK